MVLCCCIRYEKMTLQDSVSNTSRQLFFFLIFSQCMRHPFIELFHPFKLFHMLHNHKMVDTEFFSFSCILRGSVLIILSISPCQLLMAGHCTPHLQGSYLFCKTFEPVLHCSFIGSSQSRCVVDVVSCLCSFKPILN